ncbi:MAG TPA: heme-binding domain-containing protein [Candidatus Polarisedimenticolia bacterium]|nr:heme-binding domain-containing protein [Candidatus Polarisedimenticolia bacterium]
MSDASTAPVRRRGRGLVRRLLLAAAVFAAVIQVIPARRTNPPVRSDLHAPGEVKEILRRACYDCHSHETRWPWYSRVAPVSWWVVSHVNEARGDLNFSEWPRFDHELAGMALRDIDKQVTEEKMPLPSYTIMHAGARLREVERQTLIGWARSGP